MPTPLVLSPGQIRQVRILAQGLPPAARPDLAATLTATGLVRTLGGADVYVAALARVPAMRCKDLDALVASGGAQPLPAVRGCIYLVPRDLVPLCLRFADGLRRERDERDQQKAGIAPGEVDRLATVVLPALRTRGPSTTDALRRALPEGAVRSLGAAGKKVGISSPLPAALRQLEFAGDVARTLPDGRLDTEQYHWAATKKNPLTAARLPAAATQLASRLFELFLRTAGVTTVKAFAEWAGVAQRDARAALAQVEHVPVAEGDGGAELIARPDVRDLLTRAATAERAVALLPFEDNLVHLHGGPGYLIDPKFAALDVPVWGGGGRREPIGEATHMVFRGVLAEGRLRGFWEYDPDLRAVRCWFFDPPGKAAQQEVARRAAALTVLLRDDLGHGHSFSLDSDEELRKRIGLLDGLLGGKRAAKPRSAARKRPARSRA